MYLLSRGQEVGVDITSETKGRGLVYVSTSAGASGYHEVGQTTGVAEGLY